MSDSKCTTQNCKRQGITVKVSPDGEKLLTTKNRHDSEVHTQEISFTQLIKEHYTLEDLKAMFDRN